TAATTMGLLAECFETLGGVPAEVLADRMGCEGRGRRERGDSDSGLRQIRDVLRKRNGRDSNPRILRSPAFKAGAFVHSATVPSARLAQVRAESLGDDQQPEGLEGVQERPAESDAAPRRLPVPVTEEAT